ncbi:MAG: hypothetical protein AVDCRST_MAG14-140, partial [uncultured Rubrobacteraceae bacterium]
VHEHTDTGRSPGAHVERQEDSLLRLRGWGYGHPRQPLPHRHVRPAGASGRKPGRRDLAWLSLPCGGIGRRSFGISRDGVHDPGGTLPGRASATSTGGTLHAGIWSHGDGAVDRRWSAAGARGAGVRGRDADRHRGANRSGNLVVAGQPMVAPVGCSFVPRSKVGRASWRRLPGRVRDRGAWSLAALDVLAAACGVRLRRPRRAARLPCWHPGVVPAPGPASREIL